MEGKSDSASRFVAFGNRDLFITTEFNWPQKETMQKSEHVKNARSGQIAQKARVRTRTTGWLVMRSFYVHSLSVYGFRWSVFASSCSMQ